MVAQDPGREQQMEKQFYPDTRALRGVRSVTRRCSSACRTWDPGIVSEIVVLCELRQQPCQLTWLERLSVERGC